MIEIPKTTQKGQRSHSSSTDLSL